MDYTLSLLWVWLEKGVNGRASGLAGRERVGEEDTIFAGELFEGDGNEGANTADNKDLSSPTVHVEASELAVAGQARVLALVVWGRMI